MKWRQVALVSLLLVLVFSLSGCDLITKLIAGVSAEATSISEESQKAPTVKVGAGTRQPTPKATTKPSGDKTAVPTRESSDDGVDPNALTAVDQLDSYHMVQVGNFTTAHTDTTVTTSTINIEIWETKDPFARRVIYTGGQTGSPDNTFEIIVIGQDSYMKSSDSEEWFAMTTSATDTTSFGGFSWFADPSSVMNEDGQLIGSETINGMAAKHYRYTGDQLFNLAVGSGGTVDTSQADVWISDEYNLIIKYVSQYKGTDAGGVQYDYQYSTEILEVNTPITIEPPAGVDKAGLPEDVPLMPGATDVNAFAGIVSFNVAGSDSDVMDFYASALRDNGWTPGEDAGVSGMATYTKDTRTLTLLANEDNDVTSVTIMVAENQ